MMNNANGMIMNSGDNDQDHNGVVNGGGDDDDHGGTMMVAADNHGKENGDQLTLTFQGQVYVFDSVSPGKVSSSICVKFCFLFMLRALVIETDQWVFIDVMFVYF
jgi:hypothetical protein